MATVFCRGECGADELMLLAGWAVTVGVPLTLLAIRLYPVQKRAAAAYRAYRMGRLHAREVAVDRTGMK
ncbi:unnamed protein product [[Actinomadura] parvosata subsp. kistnae]|nr:unnamed protein product [Actinomadura parvosata subsp. kistnae]